MTKLNLFGRAKTWVDWAAQTLVASLIVALFAWWRDMHWFTPAMIILGVAAGTAWGVYQQQKSAEHD